MKTAGLQSRLFFSSAKTNALPRRSRGLRAQRVISRLRPLQSRATLWLGLMFIIRLSLLCLAATLTAACQSQSALSRPSPRLEIVQQWSGQHGGSTTAATRVLRTADEWKAFWQEAGREQATTPDFTRHMVVVISLGEKRTGGFSAEAIGVHEENGNVIVQYRESSPQPGMMVTQALTSPWVAVLIPRSTAHVIAQKIGAVKPREE